MASDLCVDISVKKVVNNVIIKKCSTLKYVCVFVLLMFCTSYHGSIQYSSSHRNKMKEHTYIYILPGVIHYGGSPYKSMTMEGCWHRVVKSRLNERI